MALSGGGSRGTQARGRSADAAGAAALASGAAAAAAHLVRANLTVTADDPRLKRAEMAVDDARYSASRALDSGT